MSNETLIPFVLRELAELRLGPQGYCSSNLFGLRERARDALASNGQPKRIVMVQCYRDSRDGDLLFDHLPLDPAAAEVWQPIGEPQPFEVPE